MEILGMVTVANFSNDLTVQCGQQQMGHFFIFDFSENFIPDES